ncbi:hypothetical protein [Pseudomonas sp. CGJS7]|uniref:hypothetical protein n=1 Tax=Pseudomonas sp. CGJS7 TaxID=3109348 RepID=UPI003009A3A3
MQRVLTSIVALALLVTTGCSREETGARTPQLAQSPPAESISDSVRAVAQANTGTRRSDAVERIVATRRKFADSYSPLKSLAESGDAGAAFQIYTDLRRCSSLKTREEALETLAAESSDKTLTSNVVTELSEDRIVCAGLGEEKLTTMEHWITMAARLGHPEAQIAYFSVATERFDTPEKIVANIEEIARIKNEALIHLSAAANKGNSTALFNLANHYHDGTLAKRDLVKAYAYMRILQQRGGVASATRHLDLWRREMSAEQVSSAETIVANANKGGSLR